MSTEFPLALAERRDELQAALDGWSEKIDEAKMCWARCEAELRGINAAIEAFAASAIAASKESRMTTQHDIERNPDMNSEGRAVVVTTAHRGVFFGYATDTSGKTIKLRRGRNCLFWPSENHGFVGLAADGPKTGARVGPAADLELRDITCVVECSPDAITAWENEPWN